jgi:antitoxin CptB
MDNLAKLQWRCRRGTLELDVVLTRYLQNCYASAAVGEKQLFAQLLELQDSDLLAYLFGARRPATTNMTLLVDKIRHFPAV